MSALWPYPGITLWSDSMRAIVATLERSKNQKTGNMVQTWTILMDTHPVAAVATGADIWTCLGCRYRAGQGCYVTARPVIAVWRAYRAGRYPAVTPDVAAELCRGRAVRLGAYGELVVAPYPIIAPLVTYATKWTGYTHHWRHCDRRWQTLLMASCDTPSEYLEAKSRGWRAFVTCPGGARPDDAILCPASAEAGHRIQCWQCGLCNGLARPRARSVYIPVHGSLRNRAAAQITAAWGVS